MTDKKWRTAISTFDDDGASIGGYQIQDLMENLDFGAAMFVLYQQRVPSKEEAKLLNALMVSVIDHGIVAPSAVSRIVAASGVPLQACVAAGILTIGDVHGGAGQEIARKLQIWVEEAKAAGQSLADKARAIVADSRKAKERIEGYGHPLHPHRDDRVDCLVKMAGELGLRGDNLNLALAIQDAIEEATGRHIPLNIDGIMAAVLCDLGFDWRVARVFIFVPRAAGISAHAVEEVKRERGWRKIANHDEVEYDGPTGRSVGEAAE
ncbi:MAG: citryl-CoA lyase [Alphaproteobacteria bacterium]|nr:citryl-CoA lyase [Alphaproteobacteria bacterium]MDX5370784.1 citryl-CoA lyase [Alphaproteobacteria bacterium]MDX5465196.1 citryl-CoA lyase [Alphaproteobacteria bacterium]